METPELSGIEERLERLEAEARRARSALGLLALASLAGFITLLVWMETHARERARFATIEARQIIVDPGKGRPLIRLGADETGFSRIVIGSDRRMERGIGFGIAGGTGQMFINNGQRSHLNLAASSLNFFMDSSFQGGASLARNMLILSDSTGSMFFRANDWTRMNGDSVVKGSYSNQPWKR